MCVSRLRVQLPLGFDLDAYSLVVIRRTPIAVEVVFDKATAAWARDRVWHPSQRLTPLRDGRLRMTLQVADTRELVGWILSFGSGIRVVSPPALRERVREEARKVAAGAPAQVTVVSPRLRECQATAPRLTMILSSVLPKTVSPNNWLNPPCVGAVDCIYRCKDKSGEGILVITKICYGCA